MIRPAKRDTTIFHFSFLIFRLCVYTGADHPVIIKYGRRKAVANQVLAWNLAAETEGLTQPAVTLN